MFSNITGHHLNHLNGLPEIMDSQTRTTTDEEQAEDRREDEEAAELAFANNEDEVSHVEMRFANAVPFRMGAGCVMTTPIVILLSHGIRSPNATDDVWVFVSLVDANSEQSVDEDVLQGQRADNAHPIWGQLSQMESSLAYASFPNLVISRPGNFRLRVTAIDMRYAMLPLTTLCC